MKTKYFEQETTIYIKHINTRSVLEPFDIYSKQS